MPYADQVTSLQWLWSRIREADGVQNRSPPHIHEDVTFPASQTSDFMCNCRLPDKLQGVSYAPELCYGTRKPRTLTVMMTSFPCSLNYSSDLQ